MALRDARLRRALNPGRDRAGSRRGPPTAGGPGNLTGWIDATGDVSEAVHRKLGRIPPCCENGLPVDSAFKPLLFSR